MSTLKVSTLQNLSGTEVYTCKAWVNFNGTGTVAIRASGNVSSITDNGTGDYTLNFTTSFSDSNYCCIASSSDPSAVNITNGVGIRVQTSTTTSVRLRTGAYSAGFVDTDQFHVSVFR
jgi:hypothetical protein